MWTDEELNYWLNLSKGNAMEKLEEIKGMVSLSEKEIVDANIIKVSAGTTGYKGGDTGHGGRTIFCIRDVASTDMRVSINGGDPEDVREVAVIFGGDSELCTFKQALFFAYKTLDGQQPEMSLWDRIKCAWKYKSLSWLKA